MNDTYSVQHPVLLIFFNRAETFAQVFEQVRKVRPKKLYLAQDGPRDGKNDEEEIEACRRITEAIDWECEVHRDYSEKNLGCGLRPSSAITNTLRNEETVIILEDDCIPSIGFFKFCDVLLDKYRNDERVCQISGLNHFETWDTEADYFFCKTGAIWAWATWRRAWERYDYKVELISNRYIQRQLEDIVDSKKIARRRIALWVETNRRLNRGDNISYWDHQWGLVRYLYSQYTIVPARNLIKNIGVGVESTHAVDSKVTSHIKGRNAFFIPTYEVDLPIKHPEIVVCDKRYDKVVNSMNYPGMIKIYWTALVDKLLGR